MMMVARIILAWSKLEKYPGCSQNATPFNFCRVAFRAMSSSLISVLSHIYPSVFRLATLCPHRNCLMRWISSYPWVIYCMKYSSTPRHIQALPARNFLPNLFKVLCSLPFGGFRFHSSSASFTPVLHTIGLITLANLTAKYLTVGQYKVAQRWETGVYYQLINIAYKALV